MQPFLVNIWPQFFDVCSERSKKYSLKFFSDPVVHHLWGRFIIDKAGLVAEYIQLAGKNNSSEEALFSQDRRLFWHADKDAFHSIENNNNNPSVDHGMPTSNHHNSNEGSNILFFTFDDLND